MFRRRDFIVVWVSGNVRSTRTYLSICPSIYPSIYHLSLSLSLSPNLSIYILHVRAYARQVYSDTWIYCLDLCFREFAWFACTLSAYLHAVLRTQPVEGPLAVHRVIRIEDLGSRRPSTPYALSRLFGGMFCLLSGFWAPVVFL